MSYDKNDVVKVATKLGRLVNGGVVGYYAGGKTSEVMREAIPEQLIDVVERHKKIQLGASLAQSFVPAAGLAASAALVASLWKMYYDINQVLGIKISENAGKSLTSAILTNLSSFAAQGVATTVSEGVKLIPLVGWIASAGITSVTSTAIVYGSAYLYMNALSAMYSAKGGFDLAYLSSEISGDSNIEIESQRESLTKEGMITRLNELNITDQSLCQMFIDNPDRIFSDWWVDWAQKRNKEKLSNSDSSLCPQNMSITDRLNKLGITSASVQQTFIDNPDRINSDWWINWGKEKSKEVSPQKATIIIPKNESIEEKLTHLGITNPDVRQMFIDNPERINSESWLKWGKDRC